jgi:type I restriction enzyme M protein
MTTKEPAQNKYCKSSDLSNEASVESFFVLRLLADLGYEDSEIRTKRVIDELKVAKGRKREPYRPDYLIVCKTQPRWIIDAKSVEERIEDWTYQCAGYSLAINRRYKEKPLHLYMLTNGLLTRVYRWDQEDAVLSLRFSDFVDSNPKYQALRKLLSADVVRQGWPSEIQLKDGHLLTRPAMDDVKKAFLRCHNIIHKAEKMNPQGAFVEFAKLLFVKLWEDRRLRDNPSMLAAIVKGEPLPAEVVRFSTHWIEKQEAGQTPNAVDTILFRQLVEQLEQEIAEHRRKRIFDANERLDVSPGTIKRVVQELENYYLFGIDEDLNGRMFEAFLSATMRGQALGQYFTPRSIVKLMTRLAQPKAERGSVERVLDGCCGTGGFLIEALTEMRRQVYDNTALSKQERTSLLDEIANKAIFGIDAGRNPPIARIARINMYLHGDGGSRIYMTDALRSVPQAGGADPLEVREDVKELQRLFQDGTRFDVVLTNPPFSMDYSTTVPDEEEVLRDYELRTYDGKSRSRLRSSVLFLERYEKLLRPGGRILTVIDDSVLSNRTYSFVRKFIRERFIIRGIISLHGDAFQRAGARVKTSVLYLTKPLNSSDSQPSVFVYESRYVGLDDTVPKTPQSVAAKARESAVQEMAEIVEAFRKYQEGEKGPWLVPSNKLVDRLDAKFLRPWSVSKLEPRWRHMGIASDLLENLADPINTPAAVEPNNSYNFVRVEYSGRVLRGEIRLGREITYATVYQAKPNDLVISGIAAIYGAVGVMPQGTQDVLISKEYTILRIKPCANVDPMYLCAVLRTSAIEAEWLSSASGLARHRVDWSILRRQRIPLLPFPKQQEIGRMYRKALDHEAEAGQCRSAAVKALAGLDLECEGAKDRLTRAKPPQ